MLKAVELTELIHEVSKLGRLKVCTDSCSPCTCTCPPAGRLGGCLDVQAGDQHLAPDQHCTVCLWSLNGENAALAQQHRARKKHHKRLRRIKIETGLE